MSMPITQESKRRADVGTERLLFDPSRQPRLPVTRNARTRGAHSTKHCLQEDKATMDTKVKVILDTRRDRATETVTTQFPTWAAQLRCKVGGGYNVSPSVCQAEPGKNSMTNRQIFRGEEKTRPIGAATHTAHRQTHVFERGKGAGVSGDRPAPRGVVLRIRNYCGRTPAEPD